MNTLLGGDDARLEELHEAIAARRLFSTRAMLVPESGLGEERHPGLWFYVTARAATGVDRTHEDEGSDGFSIALTIEDVTGKRELEVKAQDAVSVI